jgi:hypothetical protein
MSEANQRTDGRAASGHVQSFTFPCSHCATNGEHSGSADKSAMEYARTRHSCCLAERARVAPFPRLRHFSSCPTCAAHRGRDDADRGGQARRHSGPNTRQRPTRSSNSHARAPSFTACMHARLCMMQSATGAACWLAAEQRPPANGKPRRQPPHETNGRQIHTLSALPLTLSNACVQPSVGLVVGRPRACPQSRAACLALCCAVRFPSS